jgi:hypothetical protein
MRGVTFRAARVEEIIITSSFEGSQTVLAHLSGKGIATCRGD